MFEQLINFDQLMPFITDVAILVFLSVQGLKVYALVKENEGKVALGTALGFGILFAAKNLYAPIAPYVDLGVIFYAGAMAAGLFYRYIAKPVFEKLGWPMSNEDLNE
jgi:hypothetical protein